MQTVGFEALKVIPMPVLIGLGVLFVVQVWIDIIALIDLYKRPVEQVAFGSKWFWVVVIVFVNTIGAVIYLLAGRRPAPVTEVEPSAPAESRSNNAMDLLYGSPKDPESR